MEYSLKDGNLIVSLVDLGEGYCGDYNEDDPEDVSLLRFDVSECDINGQEEILEGASYCTLLPVSITAKQCQKACQIIMDKVKPLWEKEQSLRHVCAELSWIEPSWLQ